MSLPRFTSIRDALFATVFLALVPVLGLLFWTEAEHGRQLEDMARADILRNVETLAQTQAAVTGSVRQILSTLALLPEFQEGGEQNRAACMAIMDGVLQRNPTLHTVHMTDAAGRIAVSSQGGEGIDLSDRLHFRAAVEHGGFSAGEYILGRLNNFQIFPFSQPVYARDGRLQGVLVAALRLATYAQTLEGLRLPPDSVLGLTDHAGVRLFHHPPQDSNPPGRPIRAEVWAAIQAGGETGVSAQIGSDGVRRFYAYKKLRLDPEREPYMVLFLGLPEELVAAPARQAFGRNVALFVAVSGLTLFWAWFLSEIVLGRRLRAVVDTAGRIRGGDLSARTGLAEEHSDLGHLAQALDQMAEALQARQAEQAETSEAMSRSLREKETLLKEIHHRVKNNLQLILSLVRLQTLHADGAPDPEFPARMESRVRSMALVHEMIYESSDLGGVDLASYTPRLTQSVVRASTPATGVDLAVRATPERLSLDQAIPFALLLNELLTNACKYALTPERAGRIQVDLSRQGEDLVLRVADNGPGLPPDFDPAESPSLGLRLVASLAEQLGGRLSWENQNGAVFRVTFPAEPAAKKPQEERP